MLPNRIRAPSTQFICVLWLRDYACPLGQICMVCLACQDKINHVDYKKTDLLRKFVSGQFKISSSARTGLCQKHQRMVSNAVKKARFMALMPYTKLQTLKK